MRQALQPARALAIWRIALLSGVLILAGGPQLGWAQATGERRAPSDGFHLYSVTTYTGYTSIGIPNPNYNYLSGSAPAGPDMEWGGSISLGLLRSRPRSNVSLIYDPSYDGLAKHSEWSAASHRVSFSASRKVARKWEFRGAANGSATSLYQFLFSPTSLSNVVAIPSSFDQLAGAMLSGRFTNEQLASALTGVPGVEAPGRTALYGSRVLSGGVNSGASYAPSKRFLLRFGAGASYSKNLNGPAQEAITTQPLLPRTTSGNATVGFSYAATPRTDFGVEATATRSRSEIQDAYTP
jgi:hypothetical protein